MAFTISKRDVTGIIQVDLLDLCKQLCDFIRDMNIVYESKQKLDKSITTLTKVVKPRKLILTIHNIKEGIFWLVI